MLLLRGFQGQKASQLLQKAYDVPSHMQIFHMLNKYICFDE